MRPVTLSIIEGKNFILGTFDTTSFQTWWKSLPFPGEVETIEDITHVYGQYHVCIAKMQNGTYSIYRTHDSGKTWTSVYNTSDIIYSITQIDYGHVIASTSTGWLESTLDSGLTWTKISNFAPGCRTVINIGDNVLFAHDCSAIWRSYDIGRTWSKILSKTRWTSIGYHDPSTTKNFSWNAGYAYPALTGVGQTIFVGFGPYLVISEDNGETWFTHLQGWDQHFATYKGGWGGSNLFSPFYNTRILQLEMTDTSGTTLDDTALMARVLDLDTNNVLYAYSGENYYFEDKKTGFAWKTRFSLPFADETHGIINSYDVLRPGSSEKDKLVVVCSYDASNNAIVMHSTDNGWTWINLNHNNVSVYEGDPSQEIISNIGQYVFDEEYWTTSTWTGPPCHNGGKWIIEYNKTIRGLSWDMDTITAFTKTKNYGMLYASLIAKSKSYTTDILNKKVFTTTLNMDSLTQGTYDKNLLIGGYFKISFEKSCNMDIANALRLTTSITPNSLLLKTIDSFFTIRMNQQDEVQKSYGCDIRLVDDHVEEIMTSINRYTPQAPDVRYPRTPYVPFDSRNQEVT